jgi:hypothetical protein
VKTLQSHGICVLGSSIIGLEEHSPRNIDQVIEDAVEYDADFHQFMLYTPFPGTPLGAEHAASGTLLDAKECSEADTHGQLRFNFRHPHITDGRESQYLLDAFQRDFDVNGPSVLRVARTRLNGWLRYKNHPDRRIRDRYRRECRTLATTFAGALWAARRWCSDNPPLVARMTDLLDRIRREFGLVSRALSPVYGAYILRALRAEDARLRAGWTYEPPTFYEKNRWAENG